ncbi:MAG TPA: glycosyltransferase family 9 protein [Eoetvoesiella sp.]
MSAVNLWCPAPRKVAVFRALNLGDLLCAIPALRSLRQTLPAARITLIGLESMRPLMQRFSHYVDELIAFPGYPAFPEQPARSSALPDFYRRMQAQSFDLALQMHGSGDHSNSIVQALGARQWAGFVPEKSQQTPCLMAWPEGQPEVKRYLALLEYLGLPKRGAEMEFPLNAKDLALARQVASRVHISPARTIFIHPGARLMSRRWPLRRFTEVGRHLALGGWRIAVTGSEAERPLTSGLATAIGDSAVDLGGVTGLGALASLLTHGRLLICNDTGVSHIAAAVQLRSVIIASGSDVARWAPLNRNLHTVLHADMSCRPCAYDLCPIGHPCALAITTEQVVSAALEQLAKGLNHEQRC